MKNISAVSETTDIVTKEYADNIEPFIVGTQTKQTGAWTGVAPFSSLSDGQRILYWLPYGGSGDATLNLTLSDGTLTGAKKCYYGGVARITTQYPAGSAIRLVYREGGAVGSSTYTGWWADANYTTTDTYDRVKMSTAIKAYSAITAGNIIVGTDSGYHNLKTGTGFSLSYPILYASSAISASSTGTNNFLATPASLTATQSVTYTAYKAVYIKGTVSDGMFYPISTSPLTQDLPNYDDGYSYMLLGLAYSTTQAYLTPEHPIYKYGAEKVARYYCELIDNSSGTNGAASDFVSCPDFCPTSIRLTVTGGSSLTAGTAALIWSSDESGLLSSAGSLSVDDDGTIELSIYFKGKYFLEVWGYR